MLRPKRVIITLTVVALAAAGIWYVNRPKPIDVAIEAAEVGLVEETVANTRAGTVKACSRANLSPGIGGQIAVLDIHEGDEVKMGKLLLSLWNKDLLAEIELIRAEAVASEANAKSACLQAEVAQREANRLSRLKLRGAISEEAVDKVQTEAKAMMAKCD